MKLLQYLHVVDLTSRSFLSRKTDPRNTRMEARFLFVLLRVSSWMQEHSIATLSIQNLRGRGVLGSYLQKSRAAKDTEQLILCAALFRKKLAQGRHFSAIHNQLCSRCKMIACKIGNAVSKTINMNDSRLEPAIDWQRLERSKLDEVIDRRNELFKV